MCESSAPNDSPAQPSTGSPQSLQVPQGDSHRCHIIETKGDSHRLHHARRWTRTAKTATR
jgi:hypothetical protein